MTALPDIDVAPEVDSDERTELDKVWRTIVWNDPVNLMSYVTYVFRTYFGYSEQKATTLMLQVHNEGKAVVSSGSREKMEVDVRAMHSYGLWATLDQDS
ncbi:MAG TPA: ATP-dependent Clp protease adapter ClpS [Beutenbergiaceae bacterium]|nr:ATP-dependent Clp protease adapter ClpS [Beutenbergiaceae bacterium]